jgi:hypothetical protein
VSDEDLLDLLPPYPKELEVGRALDPIAFVLAKVTPDEAVVGQQVTLSVYAYGSRGPFREVNTSEPSRPDFVSHPIIENSYGRHLHRVPIDGELWHALKIREVALFPIRSGELSIGSMRMGFDGRRYPSRGRHRGLVRESAPLQVTVRDPPLEGRPAGYRLGDVGRFSLSATVQPRTVTAGEAISVVVTLKGKGNLPFSLSTPQRKGVQWLKPNVVDDVEVSGKDVAGWRKFTYVVRLDQPGSIDLGQLELPYFDPWQSAYRVARTGLGTVEVVPGANAASVDGAQEVDPLEVAMVPRAELGAGASPPWRPAGTPWFWGLLAFGPVSVVVARAGTALLSALRGRLRSRRAAPATIAAQALAESRQAAAAGDVATAASQAERALFTAVEGAVGLRARAVLREELSVRLTDAGIGRELAERITALLEAFDGVRFTGQSAEHAASDLVARAAELVSELGALGRVRRKRKGGS